MADTPTEIKTHPQNQINPPAIIETIDRDYGVCKIVGGQMELTRNGVRVILEKPKVADTFNWSQEERKKLNEEVLTGNLRKKLIEKYPNQKCLFDKADIRVMQMGKTYESHNEGTEIYKTNIFLFYSLEGRLLGYFDQNGNIMFDVVNFNFDEDEINKFWRDVGKTYIRKSIDGRLELFDNGKIYSEGSREFNVILLRLFINRNF